MSDTENAGPVRFLSDEEAEDANTQRRFERAEMDREDDMANWADDYDRAWSRQ